MPHMRVDFAHNAERQFAALLDFYGVRWQYEPHTFVLADGPDGCPTLAFTPDFHLVDFDIYVEITTLDQRHVTRKNRKLRLLRMLHPEVDVRILYQRDYVQLLAKYGLEPPSQWPDTGGRRRAAATEMSGLLDQAWAPTVAGPAPVAPTSAA